MWKSENSWKWELDTHLWRTDLKKKNRYDCIHKVYVFDNTHLSEKSDSINSRVRFLSLIKDNSNLDENNIIYLDQQNLCIWGLAGYWCLLLHVYWKGKIAHIHSLTKLERRRVGLRTLSARQVLFPNLPCFASVIEGKSLRLEL